MKLVLIKAKESDSELEIDFGGGLSCLLVAGELGCVVFSEGAGLDLEWLFVQR